MLAAPRSPNWNLRIGWQLTRADLIRPRGNLDLQSGGGLRGTAVGLRFPRQTTPAGRSSEPGRRISARLSQNEKRLPSWIARGPPEPNTWKMRDVGCMKLAVFLRSPL